MTQSRTSEDGGKNQPETKRGAARNQAGIGDELAQNQGWNRQEDPPSREDATIKRVALDAARAAMGGPERVPHTIGFPRAGDLDGSTDMYITRRPDPDERERAILWSDPDRDAKTRERLSRSPTGRAEAERMVVHSEPLAPHSVQVEARDAQPGARRRRRGFARAGLLATRAVRHGHNLRRPE